MKTLVTKSKNLSKYIFDDAADVSFEVRQVTVKDEVVEIPYIKTPTFTIADLNINNTLLYNNVTPPSDWDGDKYFFDGQTWTLNPAYATPYS